MSVMVSQFPLLGQLNKGKAYKSVEDANDNTDKELAIVIRWISPVLLEHPFSEHDCLHRSRCRKLMLSPRPRNRQLAALLANPPNLLQYLTVLFGVLPFLVPIDGLAAAVPAALRCSFENKLGNVLCRRADEAAISEVFDHRGTVLTDRAEVEGIPAGVEG